MIKPSNVLGAHRSQSYNLNVHYSTLSGREGTKFEEFKALEELNETGFSIKRSINDNKTTEAIDSPIKHVLYI